MRLRHALLGLLCLGLARSGTGQWKKQHGGTGCPLGPDDCVCSGSSNGLSAPHTTDRFEDLRAIYQNCTRVFGNVEITHLNDAQIGNRTLDFLDDIEEVKGYVLIYMTDLERISFKNLKIIWGDELVSDKAALQLELNPNLTVVSMPALRTVEHGHVLTYKSMHLCHLINAVNPDEILNFNRTRFSVKANKYCPKGKATCHPSCNGACWGPGAEDCQSVYRSICPDHCESKQCYSVANEARCCHAQCVAGCTGPTQKDCISCSNFAQCTGAGTTKECKCVEQCTSLRKYNPKTGQVEANPDGYYSLDNRYCEKECPVNRLVQDDVCVEHCGEGMHYDPNDKDKTCRKCDGPCPKSCKFEKKLESVNIHQLQNCTEIEGYIHIDTETFSDHGRGESDIPALKPQELEILKSVRFISEYLYIAAESAPIKSLSFLENLEFIEGRNLFNGRQALVISSNDNLDYLGLRKLKQIDKGDVIISKNTELCFMNKAHWKDIVTGANNTVTVAQNRADKVCEMEEKQCHHSCDPAFGCWGPSSADCRKCKQWVQEGRCVDKCSTIGFFKNKSKMSCDRCFAECATCTGPDPLQCETCRNLKLMKKPGVSSMEFDDDPIVEEVKKPVSHLLDTDTTMAMLDSTLPPSEQEKDKRQLTCVPECPGNRFYIRDGECKHCHRSCYDFGCDGPNNTPGPNGCKMCKYAQIDQPVGNATVGAVARCLYNSDKGHSNSVCLNNDLLNHFVQSATHISQVEDFECAPCDDECSTCTSKGISRITNKCKCKNFVFYWPFHKVGGAAKRDDERCVPQCPKGTFHDNATEEADVAGVCRVCSQMCDRMSSETGPWCTGPLDSECTNCSQQAFTYNDPEGRKICVKDCAELNLYTYHKERTCNKIDYETRDKVRTIVLILLLVLFILAVLIIALYLWRRQKRLSKELEQEKVANNPEMPELIPMDLSGPRINKQKILLITKHELSRSARELGSGAFGVVYAGCWMPKVPNKAGKPTKVPVAIKVVRDPSGRAQSEMLDEATKMTMMRHENLLRIVGVCLSGDDLQLVTLLRPLGNLREFLQKHKGKLSGKELLSYSYQIASGMKYLSDQRVVHRDLAARNVLVKNIQHVEITDFGLAKLIDIGSDSVQVGEGKVAIKWLALEALEKQVYNTATDVWAFGVTVWEILTYGESPYANKTPMAIKEFLLSGQRLDQPDNCSTELYKLLLDCWLPYPDSRPTFAFLKELLYKYCRAPYHFYYDVDQHADDTSDLDNCSQRGLIEEILNETDFEDPQNYFESEPNTPGCANTGDLFNPMVVRRMDSLGSQRYAQDPMANRKEFGMADDNYLVPNSSAAEMGATMYTPVVVDETGNSSLVESLGYYNEVKPGAEYINDTQPLKKTVRNSRDDRLSMIEEDDDIGIEKESCL